VTETLSKDLKGNIIWMIKQDEMGGTYGTNMQLSHTAYTELAVKPEWKNHVSETLAQMDGQY
jgi:hypothetical protein